MNEETITLEEPPGPGRPPHPWQDVPLAQWNDWRWQLRHRLNSLDELVKIVRLTPEEREGVQAEHRLRLDITPYFASLIDPDDPNCPIRRQIIPTARELSAFQAMMADSLNEESHSPVPGLVHRYPDRVLMLVTTQCASYCRFCTRGRIVGGPHARFSRATYDAQIDYIAETPSVRDVLISGGDPLMLSQRVLQDLLSRLRAIPHVEIIRIGSRVPVFLPQRITDDLVDMLKRFHYDRLRQVKPDICFNICEGHFGDSREAQVPAILEMLRVPYTGSQVLTLALTLDKPMTKRVLAFHDLPTPSFQVIERADEPLDPELDFPLFLKPSRQGTSMGISPQSIVRSQPEFRAQLRHLLQTYLEPVLVERFIDGQEITVGLVGNLVPPVAWRVPDNQEAPRVQRGLRFLPPLEIDLGPYAEQEAGIYTQRAKVELAAELNYVCPAPLEPELVEELNWLAAATFRVTGCLDVARVDFRLDQADGNKPYILEINPLPGLAPGISDLVIEAQAAGIEHTELVNLILDEALERYGLA